MPNKTITTTPPTEPGRYLFYGDEKRRLRLDRKPRPQIVRVSHDANKKLTYIGNDFMYDIDNYVGGWVELDTEELNAVGDAVILEALVDRVIEEEKRYHTAEWTVESFTDAVTSKWSKSHIADDAARAVLIEAAKKRKSNDAHHPPRQ